MKHLTYLLLWLSVLTLGHAAYAANSFLPATASTATLPLPSPATEAPIGSHDNLDSPLPPPPPSPASQIPPPDPAPLPAPNPTATTVPNAGIPLATPIADRSTQLPSSPSPSDPGGTLSFSLPTPTLTSSPPTSPSPQPPTDSPTHLPTNSPTPLDPLFTGNENSLVAKAVGAAEGTRSPNGDRNPAYYGHTDPGNGVWNLGSFSYQHAALSPEDADAKQLARLRSQADQILQKASDKGLTLTVTEKLNGIDLANQAPMAALGEQGYVDWLAVAKAEGKAESDAVLSARVRSFINPNTQQWDAPGLGNSEERITRDQARRMAAIQQAILANPQQVQIAQTPASPAESQLLSQQPANTFSPIAPTQAELPAASHTIAEAPNTDFLINLNL